MTARAEALAFALFERLPPAADGILRRLRRTASVLDGRRLTTERRAGEGVNGPATLALAGKGASLAYVAERFLPTVATTAATAETTRGDLAAWLREAAAGADLAIAAVPRRTGVSLLRQGFTTVPEAVGARLAVQADGTTFKDASATARRNVRQVEKRGFAWSVTHDIGDFEHFYDRMYVPFARRRYGDLAFVRNRHALRRRFRHGGLLRIDEGGTIIAAQLFKREGDRVEMLGPGTLDGDPGPVKRGAFSALYVFAEAYAREQGLKWLDFGASLPALSDGVLGHKRGWGAEIEPRVEADRDLVLCWQKPTPALVAFLRAHPLIVHADAGLALLAAPDFAEPTPKGLVGVRRVGE